MKSDFKEYLGAIEIEVEGFRYEIGLRQEGDCGVRGIWSCVTCTSTAATSKLMPTEREAIELAKRFGTTDSGRFVNGILEKIAKEKADAGS